MFKARKTLEICSYNIFLKLGILISLKVKSVRKLAFDFQKVVK